MKTENGFTLIELLIVVALVAILSAVAIPNYTAYVIRGKLAEGTSALSDGRVKMEQFFQDNRTYVGGPAPVATTYFTYAASGLSTTAYILTATGIGSMNGFAFTIDQSNTKVTTGVPPGWTSSATCWVVRKNGSCT
jgi:type IV pilus assembly protein PilE